jgi:hypothetical protein
MGVKEIADWLKYHDEVVFIRIHDDETIGEGDDPTKHPKHVLKPFEEYLGASKISAHPIGMSQRRAGRR